jgi:hypothetical protein
MNEFTEENAERPSEREQLGYLFYKKREKNKKRLVHLLSDNSPHAPDNHELCRADFRYIILEFIYRQNVILL